MFYQPVCPGCSACKQIRISSSDFVPHASHVRALKKNRDLRLAIETDPSRFELLDLYRRYVVERHGHTAPLDEDIISFLGAQSTPGFVMTYLAGEKIIGAGWLDQVDDGLSSVYFAFDPLESKRSLGVYSTIKELELCKTLGLSWLYMGFWVAGSKTMSYKADFQPHEILEDGQWKKMASS